MATETNQSVRTSPLYKSEEQVLYLFSELQTLKKEHTKTRLRVSMAYTLMVTVFFIQFMLFALFLGAMFTQLI